MSTRAVEINFKFPDMLSHLRTGMYRVLIGMASDIQTNRGLLFDAEGAFNGHQKWKNLASGKNLIKAKNGLMSRQILHKTGALRLSLSPTSSTGKPGPDGYVKFEGDIRRGIVKIGTNLKYAAIHDQGGVIMHPGTDNGFGKGIKIKAHKIKIPKRNFSDWNAQDGANMTQFLKNLTAVLNGK